MGVTSEDLIKMVIPAAAAFMWFLAYKHPGTFKPLASLLSFFAAIALVGSAGYLIAWEAFSAGVASYSGVWGPLREAHGFEIAGLFQQSVESEVNRIGRVAVPIAVTSGATLALLGFFAAVSGMIKIEKSQEAKANKEDDKPEADSSEQPVKGK